MSSLSLLVLVAIVAAAPSASAQRRVQYDTLTSESPAAISCGFCAGERFGMVFRPLDSGGGLRADEFPLTLTSVDVGVARTQITGGILEGYTCSGTAGGGMVSMMIEVYAGPTAPRGSITSMPGSGPWPGETQVFAESAELNLSVETTPGSRMYEVMLTSVPISARVDAPNTYLRVVVTIPSGASTSASCSDLGLEPPSAVGLRDDDGRIENNVGFIYAVEALGGAVPAGWHWNESSDISDPATGATGIGGDWAIRLDVAPAGSTTSDAGVRDASTTLDAGTSSNDDAGSSSTSCTEDRECAGGERCSAGECVRVTCTMPTDCAGGMTCVGGMCRVLCDDDDECRGGEVCSTMGGYCMPVSTSSDGGCGCRAVGATDARRPITTWAIGLLLALVIARRRAAQRSFTN
ncbi:hypothetical protein DB32_007681 [Sandaracinus amylolyticus]|uniref:Uncharacterized protein n=1 Tax=Sandaracinus amylolyticus TaxID=927083 RepID=A0A0F6YLM7_9BACT|nr:hypothetical protein DB32_007681 [Sandaracinus amylolyticus]